MRSIVDCVLIVGALERTPPLLAWLSTFMTYWSDYLDEVIAVSTAYIEQDGVYIPAVLER